MKTLAYAMFVLVLSAGLASAKQGEGKQKEGKGGHCPMEVKGAKVTVEKTDKGAVIRIEGDNPEAVKKIQAHAEAHGKGGHMCADCAHGKAHEHGAKGEKSGKMGSCPMKGCYDGPMTKDGRCPNCGMKLEEKKEEKK